MECGGCLLSPICSLLSSLGRMNRGLFACPLLPLYSSCGEAVSSLWALRQGGAASLPAPSPQPAGATCAHKPNAAGGLQRPSPLKSSSGSALRSAQEPAIPFPAPIPPYTHKKKPPIPSWEGKADLRSITYSHYCMNYCYLPLQCAGRSSESKE